MAASYKKTQSRLLLARIAQRLSESDIKDLVFLCEDVLTKSVAETIKCGTDLIRQLQFRGYVGPEYYIFLRGCLLSIGRSDLAMSLPNVMTDHDSLISLNPHATTAVVRFVQPTDEMEHRKIMLCISNNLGKEDLFKLVYLCMSKVHINKEITSGLELLNILEQRNLLGRGKYDLLSDCLKQIGRVDLLQFLCAHSPLLVHNGFEIKSQVLALMVEGLQCDKQYYTKSMRMISRIANGDHPKSIIDLCFSVQSQLLKSLSIALDEEHKTTAPSSEHYDIRPSLASAFDSLIAYCHCVLSQNENQDQLQISSRFNYMPSNTAIFDRTTSSPTLHVERKQVYSCLVPASAYTANKFIYTISRNLLESSLLPEVQNMAAKNSMAIELCSYPADSLFSSVKCLLGIFASAVKGKLNIRAFQKELITICTEHGKYITAFFPLISQCMSKSCSEYLASILSLSSIQPHSSLIYGILSMLAVPLYVILLTLLAMSFDHRIDAVETISKLREYIEREEHCHNERFSLFVCRAGASIQANIDNFKRKILELDNPSLPVLKELLEL